MADASIQELREVNRLVYLRPDNGALINSRTMKSYNFSSASYIAGQTAQCIINSGGDAIWGPTSYIRMQFTVNNGGETELVGTGSVLNFFKNVRLSHRSGEPLEYVQTANLLGKIKLHYELDAAAKSKLSSVGDSYDPAAAMQHVGVLDLPAVDASAAAGVTFTRYVPLWLLFGVFGNKDQMIPPGMLAGAKVEIDLETNAIAFSRTATLTNLNMTLVLDSAQVYDSVVKQLLDEQADVSKSGLQFSYSTWFNSHGPFASSSVNFDVQQAASITQKAVAVVRLEADLAADIDSFKMKTEATSLQWRLASSFYPQQALTLSAGNQHEAYGTTLVAFDGSPMQYEGSTSSSGGTAAKLANWAAAPAGAGAPVGNAISAGCYAQTMEKSSTGLQLSGEPTNNSRLLALEMTKPAVADRVDVFLQYLRICNLMGDNVVIDR